MNRFYCIFYSRIALEGKPLGKVKTLQGGVHSVVIFGDDNNAFSEFTLTNASSVHMLWQVPQYAVLTLGEVLFTITGYELAYNEVGI